MAKPKPKHKSVQTGFRLIESRKKRIEARAKMNGQSLQDFISESLNLREGIADEFWEELGQLAEVMQLPIATIIANKIIKLVSFDYVWREVFGSPPPGSLSEFQFDAEGLITGEVLLKKMNAEHRALLKDIKSKLEKSAETGEGVRVSTAEMEKFVFGFRTDGKKADGADIAGLKQDF